MNERRIIQTGIDVSRYQGKIDWARVKAGGTGFAIIKCTQGVNTVDPEFHRNMRNCAAVGLSVGAYVYSKARTAFAAAEEAERAAARLRPILMTSLAMIVGLLPLMFASGAGANGNRTLGTSAIGGMLIGMILQIFIVPALFVAFQYLQEKFKPMEWEDVDNSDAEPEIEQYTK